MTRKPTTAADSAMRVVIVTMDNHLAGAAARASRLVQQRFPTVSLSIHAASEWADDASALARCKADIATGDIVIASMLFMEDHFAPVLPDLQARRDQCDAMVCIMSAGEVMRLTRIGRFSMDGTTRGPMAFLKKLRGKSSDGKPAATAGAQQMKMLRRLPKLLRRRKHCGYGSAAGEWLRRWRAQELARQGTRERTSGIPGSRFVSPAHERCWRAQRYGRAN
jgi:magnesium chelatase subunit H